MHSILLCISVGTALLLALSYARSEPYDYSVLDLIASTGLSATVLYAAQRYYPSIVNPSKDRKGRYDAIPLNDVAKHGTLEQKEQSSTSSSRLSVRNHIILVTVAIVALTARIGLHKRISTFAQCTTRSWEVLIPLLLAINECRYQQRAQPQEEEISSGVKFSFIPQQIKSFVLYSRWRYVPSAFMITYGCYLVGALWVAQNSTYICPVVSGHTSFIPRLQLCAMVLDCLLAVVIQEIVRSNNSSRHKLLSVPLACAGILLGTFLCLTVYGTILHFSRPEDTTWLPVDDTPSGVRPFWLMLGQALLFSIFILSSLHCILHIGVYHLAAILVSCVTIFLGVSNLWSARSSFPPSTSNASMWSFFVILFGLCSSCRIAQTMGRMQSFRSLVWPILSFSILLILVMSGFRSPVNLELHPIEVLMFNANVQHEQWLSYACKSSDLQSAISIYQQRYQRNPPPGFDKWFEYAQNRSVLVLDDYDQIYRDLLPFQSVSPEDLRRQTWEMVSNPWNEISGISIRDGKAEVQENVLPTHRWMLEGVAIFVNTFAQHLPDMDLAFNLNDESRVAVPFAKLDLLRNRVGRGRPDAKSFWSRDRASTWLPVAKEVYDKTVFENFSFQKNFRRFGSIGCPPDSLSQTQPYLSSQSHLCLQCLEPHSLGQFVSNWTLAADMCHQPDMSHFHGFYLSPAAFKTTHELMPVFSQSKAGGYNDILYPSSWNYMDKVKYEPTNATGEYGTDSYSEGFQDPPFMEKESRLYWRGATSEGVSAGVHAWLGMTRQRLVHLANNATSRSEHDQTTILLPDLNKPHEYVYHSLPGTALTSLGLQQLTDIKLADHIARCGGVDCTDQEKEFGLVTPVNFQAHWKYKFLFDMDGAGFSGRFLPFLQSRSLPFKTALFREWYDSRIKAWRHFVPIDMRLHGVWSTLAYFAGAEGVWPGNGAKKYKWEPHNKEAEAIAEEGRNWANQVLRKEDMEAYFFRLLLEWGRLTDDRRDELGFVLP